MKKKKILLIFLLLIIVLLLIFILIYANFIKYDNTLNDNSKDDSTSEIDVDENVPSNITNVVEQNSNFIVLESGDRENISSVIKEEHNNDNIGVIVNSITSKNGDERYATINIKVINNSDMDLINYILLFTFYDEDNNELSDFPIEIDNLVSNDSVELEFRTYYRIIDSNDYNFESINIDGHG